MNVAGTTLTENRNPLNGKELRLAPGRFDANQSFSKGQALALVTATAVNAVLTFTITGSPTTGSFKFSFLGKTLTIPYNCSAATLSTLCQAVFGTGNYSTGGGAWPGTALTITLTGIYAGLSPVVPTLVESTVDTGTVAVTVSTTNVPNGKLVKWDPTKIANPTTVLSVSAAGTGTFAAGSYSISYTWANANGETLAAPATSLALSGSQAIRVAAINAAGTPDDATSLKVYVNGVLAKVIAVATPGSGGNVLSTDIAIWDTAISGAPLPTVNTALVKTDGRQSFYGFANRMVTTDATGAIFHSSTTNPGTPGVAGNGLDAVVVGGMIDQVSLAGISDWTEWLRQTGAKIMSGTVAGGNAVFALSPLGPQ